MAVELLERLCKSFPERRFHAYADSPYGGQSVLALLPANCDLTSRLPLDARLYVTTLRYACLRAAISANPHDKQGRQNLLLLLLGSLKAAA